MTEIRKNKAKQKLADGGVATIASGYMTADLIEFIGQFDFDGVWIEGEHGPIDFGDLPDLTRACDLWGITSVARVNLNLPGVIYRTMDVGAQAIVVPHVNTADEARAVVDAAKFHPIGTRGSYTSRQGVGVENYYAKANAETMVVVLIEDIIAVNNLSGILKVDDIDVFFVAPGDLAQSMGYLGQPTHQEVQEVVGKVIDQITSAGRVAGTVANDATVEGHIVRGARFLQTVWTAWLASGATAFLDKVGAVSR